MKNVKDVENTELQVVEETEVVAEEKETFKMKAAKVWNSKPVTVVRKVAKVAVPAVAGFVAGVFFSKAGDAASDEDTCDYSEDYSESYDDGTTTEE